MSTHPPVTRLYNTPLEIGIRSLIILYTNKAPMDVDRLMYFDYLCLHTRDIDGPESLHAPIPNRGVQVYSKRELIRKGISVLVSKELIDVAPDETGFCFQINEAGIKFLSFFQTTYFVELVERAFWVANKFSNLPTPNLRMIIDEKIPHWGSEFTSIEQSGKA